MKSETLIVRDTRTEDIDRVLEIFDRARAFMVSQGNLSQWQNGYPSASQIEKDISIGCSHVITTTDGRIVGTFYFYLGEDPTYDTIDGEWPDNNLYGTIHRIASDGTMHGIADTALEYCLEQIADIRVDTHADNRPMQNWATSRGFVYCGIIRIADGSPRLAYQLKRRP